MKFECVEQEANYGPLRVTVNDSRWSVCLTGVAYLCLSSGNNKGLEDGRRQATEWVRNFVAQIRDLKIDGVA